MARQKIVVCDTNVVIEYFKQDFSVMNEMERIGYENLAVSAITIGEMYFGALNKQELSKIKIKIESTLKKRFSDWGESPFFTAQQPLNCATDKKSDLFCKNTDCIC